MSIELADHELEFIPIRAQGPGGQNVNKVSNAVQLRFDVRASSLPEALKGRLLQWPDRRIGSDGVVVIKAQTSRSLAANKLDARARLEELLRAASHVPKARRATHPTRGSVERRLQSKTLHATLKSRRAKVELP